MRKFGIMLFVLVLMVPLCAWAAEKELVFGVSLDAPFSWTPG